MGYTVKVEHPHFPQGTVFNVGGLDRVPNGSSLEIDEETERLFIMQNGQTLEDAFANDAVVNLSGNSSLSDDEISRLLPESEEEESTEETPAWMSTESQTTNSSASREGGEENA